MKAESALLCQYAWRLVVDKIITKEDFYRIEKSIESKAVGFIHDMSCLLDDFRLALSTGYFSLGEHTRCVFERSRSSVLPRFLRVLWVRVFDTDGTIRDDFDADACKEIIALLSLLKRTDPPKGSGPVLSSKVWSTLEENFSDYTSARHSFVTSMNDDDVFAEIMTSAKEHFQERLSRIPFEANLVYGPGKNLDKHPSELAMDWTLDLPEQQFKPCFGSPATSIRRLYRKIRPLMNHHPFIGMYDARKRTRDAAQVLRSFSYDMACTAVPKSYKAYRGVGVMPAGRMTLQLSLQKSFYRHALDDNLPLSDQTMMEKNILENFEHIGTIDLSSASDRCYWWLLDFFGAANPFYQMCRSLRTTRLLLPKGKVIRCSSPVMGEAITFPLMSTLFVSTALAVCDYYGWGHEMVRVYGDDIQTPHYDETLQVLRAIGAKPSLEKSYPPISRFKESCEAHYVGDFSSVLTYVRPVYAPTYQLNARQRINHSVALQLLLLGMSASRISDALAQSCADIVELHTSLRLPHVSRRTDQLGRPADCSEDASLRVITHEKEVLDISFLGHVKSKLRSCISSNTDPHVDPKVSYIHSTRKLIMQTKRLVVQDSRNRLEAGLFRYYFQNIHGVPAESAKVLSQKTDNATISCAITFVDPELFSLFVNDFLGRIQSNQVRRAASV